MNEGTPNDGLLSYRGAVYPWHCDHMGHMNVMWYVGKFDEATWHFFAALGMTPAFLRSAGRGMAAVEQHITYRRELLAGDVVTVSTRLLEAKDKSLRFRHDMHNEVTRELAASTVLVGVHLDLTTRRAAAFAPEIRARATSFLGEAGAGVSSATANSRAETRP